MSKGVLSQYSNRHLTEVNCGFSFQNETTEWDSTFFGVFYEKIKDQGFTEKQQRKGIQIKFEGNLINTPKSPVSTSQIEDQVIFRNSNKGWAIVMGKNKISFHIVKGYTIWTDFVNNFIMPFSEIYKSIGLGNGTCQCNVVYLNSFIKPESEKLSDFFTIISPIDTKFGIEANTFVQRLVSNKNALLVAKLNSVLGGNGFNINLECGAVCVNQEAMNDPNWINQANLAHDPIKDFFEELITEKLRNEL
jgi:uncharacterized protein (TIGR04255 family)